MTDVTEKQLMAAADLRFLQPALPYIMAELDKQREQAIQRTMNLYFEKKLTGEAAIGAWMEVITVEKLKKSLLTKVALASGKA